MHFLPSWTFPRRQCLRWSKYWGALPLGKWTEGPDFVTHRTRRHLVAKLDQTRRSWCRIIFDDNATAREGMAVGEHEPHHSICSAANLPIDRVPVSYGRHQPRIIPVYRIITASVGRRGEKGSVGP